LVLLSCHEDLIGSGRLEPDWVYETRPMKLSRLSSASSDASAGSHAQAQGLPDIGGPISLRTPWDGVTLGLDQVRLEVRRALPCEWAHFREHHYKDHSLSSGAYGWVGLLAGRPVAVTYAAVLAPNYVGCGRLGLSVQVNQRGDDPNVVDREYLELPEEWAFRPGAREHRTVVLPDFQGCSLGSAMSDAVAREHELQGHIFVSKTVHPHFGSYRDRSPFWRPCPNNHVADKDGRPFYHHFWVGALNPDGTTDPVRARELQARISDQRGAKIM